MCSITPEVILCYGRQIEDTPVGKKRMFFFLFFFNPFMIGVMLVFLKMLHGQNGAVTGGVTESLVFFSRSGHDIHPPGRSTAPV